MKAEKGLGFLLRKVMTAWTPQEEGGEETSSSHPHLISPHIIPTSNNVTHMADPWDPFLQWLSVMNTPVDEQQYLALTPCCSVFIHISLTKPLIEVHLLPSHLGVGGSPN